MHAFGPVTGAFFSVAGKGARESVSEEDLGLGYPLGIAADSFARTFEAAVEARGVPFACVGGEDRDVSLEGARWIVCATSGGLNPALFRRLEEKATEGVRVTLGPREPLFDGAYRPLAAPLDLARLRLSDGAPVLLEDDPAAADAAVSRAIAELGLPTWACDPDGIFATVHEDGTGRARVVFVLNAGDGDVLAHVHLGVPASRAVDLLDDTTFGIDRGALEVRMTPRTVRMLALDCGDARRLREIGRSGCPAWA
jgi:beta-galactosidase